METIKEIAKKIFKQASFDLFGFDFEAQYHYPSDVSFLMERANVAIIQVANDRPKSFYYQKKAYHFVNGFYSFDSGTDLPTLLKRASSEVHPLIDGSQCYLFNLN